MVVWRSGSALVSISEFNLHRARLVLGWVTVSGSNSQYCTFISVCNQPPRSTQPGHPFVGTSRRAVTSCCWEVKAGCVSGWQEKLCDTIVTHGPYLSALEIRSLYKALYNYKFICLLYFTLLYFTVFDGIGVSFRSVCVCLSVCLSAQILKNH